MAYKIDKNCLNVWRHPNTGGACLAILVVLSVVIIFFIHSYSHHRYLKEQIYLDKQQLELLEQQTKQIKLAKNKQNDCKLQYNLFLKKQSQATISIESVKELLQKWQLLLGINYLTVTFDKIVEKDKKLLKAEVHLDWQTLSDKNFFQFLEKIENELPGIVDIKKFYCKKMQNIDSKLAQKLFQGEKVNLFNGIIVLELICQNDINI